MPFASYPKENQAVQVLQRSLAAGRLSHAYLFTGGNLEELEDAARTLAQTLNCQNPPQRSPAGIPLDCCGECLSCRKIASGNHPDTHWVRPESKSRVITIDQIRAVMGAIFLKATEAECKVAVLVAVDRLNAQAANAFLKTLEEPPPKSVFLLLSTEPERILETILSRCLRLSLGGAGDLRLSGSLQDWLGRFSQTAAGESKTLLGRYRLLSSLLARLAQTREEAEKEVGARSPLERDLPDVDARLKEKWEDELAAGVEAEYRRRRSEALLAVEWWLRDVWLQSQRLSADFLAFPHLRDQTSAVASRISPEDAKSNLDVLENTQRLLGSNVQEALTLEVGLLKLKL